MATRKVRMLVGVSGSRHDGRPWPPVDGEIEVPGWEADDLIAGGNAVPAGRRVKEKDAGWEPPGTTLTTRPGDPETEDIPDAQAPVAEVAAVPDPAAPRDPEDEHDRLEAVADGTEQPEYRPPAVPAPSEPKQAWIDYAVACGAEQDKAAAMTKADLMSRYGGRL